MRTRMLLPAVALLAIGAAPAISSAASAATVPVLAIDGRGHGHGVGMAHDGAYWMGASGASTGQILDHFYPGTSIARASGSVRVAVLTSPSGDAVVAFPGGGEVRDGPAGPQAPGFPLVVGPGGQVRVWADAGGYHAQLVGGAPARPTVNEQMRVADATPTASIPPLPTTTTLVPRRPANPIAPPPSSTTTTSVPQAAAPPVPPALGRPPSTSRPLWALPRPSATVAVPARDRRYRGAIEAVASGALLRLVNQLDVEEYLLGMGEVQNPHWAPASLRAQAVAARTYALRAVAGSGELCDDTRCQVYLGEQAEYPAMSRAVADTRAQVLVFGHSLASAVYSTNGGGVSATPEEGFGTGSRGFPYLRAAPYATRDPDPWLVRVGLSDLGARFSYRGTVTGVSVSRAGPSGRAMTVTLDGSAGPQTVDGLAFAAGLGLRSTLFSFRMEEADAAPPPPAAAGLIQTPPDQLVPAAEGAPEAAQVPALVRFGSRSQARLATAPTRLPWVIVAVVLLGCATAARRYLG